MDSAHECKKRRKATYTYFSIVIVGLCMVAQGLSIYTHTYIYNCQDRAVLENNQRSSRRTDVMQLDAVFETG